MSFEPFNLLFSKAVFCPWLGHIPLQRMAWFFASAQVVKQCPQNRTSQDPWMCTHTILMLHHRYLTMDKTGHNIMLLDMNLYIYSFKIVLKYIQAWKFRSCSPALQKIPAHGGKFICFNARASACWNQDVSTPHTWTSNIIQVRRSSMWRFGC